MGNKRILIIRACGINDETQECNNIKNQCELYDIDADDFCIKTNLELEKILSKEETSDKGKKYDYIYLSSHGNAEGFGNNTAELDYTWKELGALLCESDCMKEDCVILLSCCRGGLNQVAYTLFFCCDKISYVVGPRQSLGSEEMLISFNILLFNLENRKIDPIVACDKIKLATDIRFVCFDRLEIETQTDYIDHKQKLEDENLIEEYDDFDAKLGYTANKLKDFLYNIIDDIVHNEDFKK
jgi:hypothetical protein